MPKLALYVPLKARPGKETELRDFLKQGAQMAAQEPGTSTWYALDEGDGRFSIFDTFEDESGRDAHLSGPIAKALMAKADELLADPPQIHKISVLATKG
ncbi:antibiotic biosynthesis monooxygenase [Edaphobacter sp. HDX4]|jgi:quinol monooxygenase YgiN|uniref:putative quinol monooxygenase n=1 Tax=Edaphobacter sp. HDX4 TaxID=2794064 RepID=UPI002FE69517